MGIWDLEFGYRILILIGILSIASAVEVAFRGTAAVRWRLSLYLLITGAMGAVLGIAVDLVTSSISTAYFQVGKGLGPEPGIGSRIVQLGLEAGTFAGLIVGCVYVFAGTVGKSAPRVPRAILVKALAAPLLGAVLAGTLGAAVGLLLVPENALGELREHVADSDVRSFLVVWSTHAGIYAGAVVGTIFGALAVWRHRKSMRPGRRRHLAD